MMKKKNARVDGFTVYVVHSSQDMIGKEIEIYWDGDRKWYACTVTGYTPTTAQYDVEYHSDGSMACEDLSSTIVAECGSGGVAGLMRRHSPWTTADD